MTSSARSGMSTKRAPWRARVSSTSATRSSRTCRCSASRWRSRTTSARGGCPPPPAHESSRVTTPRTTRRRSSASRPPVRSSSARRTAMNSRWARRPRIPRTALHATPGTANGSRVDPAAARPLRWRRGWCRSRSGRIRADQSASRPRCAESSGSSRRTDGSRGMACSRSRPRWIRSGRSRRPSKTPRSRSVSWPDTIRTTPPAAPRRSRNTATP